MHMRTEMDWMTFNERAIQDLARRDDASRIIEAALREKGVSLSPELLEECVTALLAARPYGSMCQDMRACTELGYCPRDPTCGD